MEFPESVLRATEGAALRFPDDIETAVSEAESAIRALPEYKSVIAMLVRTAVQELVYRYRQTSNVRMRRESGYYGGEAKVVVGASEKVKQACESAYAYYIAGKTLGSIRGADLAGIAEGERSVAGGHLFNAELCEALRPLVPADKMVKDVVPEKKLKDLFRKAQRKANKAA